MGFGLALDSEPVGARLDSTRSSMAFRPINRVTPLRYCAIKAHMRAGIGELGRRIGVARRSGMTQETCASRAGLSRTALAKIETGTRRVGAVELARLAEALDMRIEWFFDDAPAAVVSRRNATDTGGPSPEIDRAVDRVAREVAFLQEIGDSLKLAATPGVPVPRSVEDAEATGLQVRNWLGYGSLEPAVELARRVADIGLLAFSLKIHSEGADGASILLNPGGVAVVNGTRALGRRRLTLAHELGHYVFADEYSTDWRVGETSAHQTEGLIDRFARTVLLPERALLTRWRGGDDFRTTTVRVASEFRVDMSTLAQRLTELGLASPSEAAEVRATRTKQADIVEYDLFVPTELNPPELPAAYVKAVLAAYRSEEISAARALGLLLDTWDESDLPQLPQLPIEAVWSFVS